MNSVFNYARHGLEKFEDGRRISRRMGTKDGSKTTAMREPMDA